MKNQMHFIFGMLLVGMFLLPKHADAQFSAMKKDSRPLLVAVGGGVTFGEMTGLTMLGGNLTFEARLRLAQMGRNFSITSNATVIMSFGSATVNKSDKFLFIPSGLITLNINAFSQATAKSKNKFGGFLGIGLLVLNPQEGYSSSKGEQISSAVGPGVMAGPRFRAGGSFIDVRVFGGMTMGGDSEFTYGGINMMWTLGMGGKRIGGMQ